MGAELSGPDSYYKGTSIDQDWSNWMSGIPDSRSLTDMSIPGTHDSMALYGGAMIACQTMSLFMQFMAGIRFVDIRCRHYYNGFAIHHGAKYQNANFDAVLTATQNFLRDHPTETILMSIKPEHTPGGNTESFSDTFKKYVSKYGSSIFWLSSSTPTLGQVRGKIVIINRWGGGPGIPWDWFDIKDDYTVNTILRRDIDGKRNGIIWHLNKARRSSRSTWFITFCSGASGGAYPNAVAERINVHVKRYAEQYKGNGRLGVVVLDFPGSWVIHAIFMTNSGAIG